MAGTMISAGRTKTVHDGNAATPTDGTHGLSKLRAKKGIVFKIFGTVILPGQMNSSGLVADKYEVELAPWYRESLLIGNCFVIDHTLFAEMKGSLSKLLHQLLHNLFYLGKGHAEQRYTDLVRFWQIKKHTMKSKVVQQFAEAHHELSTRGFLDRWQILPVGLGDKKDFVLVWEAGPAWWKTESRLPELLDHYELGAEQHYGDQVIDPFLAALPGPPNESAQDASVDSNSAARILHEILELSGRRKDPDVWEKWWRRAITAVPHSRIWLRIGEVKERKARGERINVGSYLVKLIKVEAKGLGLGWGEDK
jgi:hypothetical protein